MSEADDLAAAIEAIHDGVLSLQRSRRQGPVGDIERTLMRRLTPHLRQAHDMARRLQSAGAARGSLEQALDWLADGAVLMRADRTVTSANEAFRTIARGGDGIALRKSRVELTAAEARLRLDSTLAAACRASESGAPVWTGGDFPVPRSSDKPPYLACTRPLLHKGRLQAAEAVAVMFIRDPLRPRGSATSLLSELFGLTDAEANLALALQAGFVPADYARSHTLSVNTVYTHLRRIKDKTMAALIGMLNHMQMSLRPD